jgi:hypothetical protein
LHRSAGKARGVRTRCLARPFEVMQYCLPDVLLA